MRAAYENFANMGKHQGEFSELKQATIAYISSQLISKQDRNRLGKLFREFDKDGSGTLSKEELTEALKGEGYKKSQIEEMFDLVDIDESGAIEFQEFLVAAMDHEKLMSAENLNAAFTAFDENGNGQINADEIMIILKKTTNPNDVNEAYIKELIDKYDSHNAATGRRGKDEQISREEFFAMFGIDANKVAKPQRQPNKR